MPPRTFAEGQPLCVNGESVDILDVVVASTGGVAAGVVGDRLALRRERNRGRELRRREAGERALTALREIRTLFRESHYADLPSAEWARTIVALGTIDDDVRHRLPEGWRHVMYSVRAAVGEYAGVACFADVDRRAGEGPLASHDEEWRQNGLDYVDYLISRLQQWTDEPSADGRKVGGLLDYDVWLARTGRHDAFDLGLPHRGWRLLHRQGRMGL